MKKKLNSVDMHEYAHAPSIINAVVSPDCLVIRKLIQ